MIIVFKIIHNNYHSIYDNSFIVDDMISKDNSLSYDYDKSS